jgi:hypothetical protein
MLVAACALSVGLTAGTAHCATDLKASVILGKGGDGLVKRTYQIGEPLNLSLAIQNTSVGEIIIASTFLAREYHLDLQFTRFLPDSGKEVITAKVPVNMGEPQKPKMRITTGGQVLNLPVKQVDILPAGWASAVDWFNALDYYTLVKAGRYEVRAVIPREIYDPPVVQSDDGFSYKAIDSAILSGDLVSAPQAFHIVANSDGDCCSWPEAYGADPALADCDDNDADVYPGAVEIVGDGIDNDCDPSTPDVAVVDPGFIAILAHTHTVGAGSYPGSTKEPLEDLSLRIYDMSEGSCVKMRYGVSWQHYPDIWWGCNPAVTEGVTDTEGMVTLAVPPGTYLVIGMQDPDDTPRSGDEIYIGNSVGDVTTGITVAKYLQIIVKANGKKVPAKYTRKTGSELLIIEPEYVEWDGTEELYPFVFESVGDWGVTTSVAPPEGFVADNESLSEEVTSEVEAVQFVIKDIGSEWVDTQVEHDLDHKGKKEKVKSKIGVKLSKELAKQKGLDIYGKKMKAAKKKKK